MRRRMRAEHLKARGDEALKQGNYRLAWERCVWARACLSSSSRAHKPLAMPLAPAQHSFVTDWSVHASPLNAKSCCDRYGEALALAPDKASHHALHANRSLALLKAGRAGEALEAANAAAAAAPAWPKAQWRRAAALLALRRVPDAVAAFAAAWRLDRGDGETRARLWATVQRLTREELARCVLRLLGEAQAGGALEPPREEEASEAEQAEALFRHLRAAHQGQPRPGIYYRRWAAWV